jgi:hypothetical protein
MGVTRPGTMDQELQKRAIKIMSEAAVIVLSS